jgi:hypothetical protein
MCWDIDNVHRNDSHLIDADYWLRLGADICFDPLFKSNLEFDWGLRERFPAPRTLPMRPENMPYYQGPRVTSPPDAQLNTPSADCHTAANTADHYHCQSLFLAMINDHCHGLCHLANVSVCFGDFNTVTPMDAHEPSNHVIPIYAITVLRFSWALYSFGGGHFASIISSRNLPFNITLACNNYKHSRALLHNFLPCPYVFSSGTEMLHHICASGETS